ncbi:MerR family transcriptional regulator [Rhodococcus sp. NPDC058505]|uniref:DNA polymerase III subunit beta family protein n=1 Tax=unclassified Rhodococcus (in: high G+C Gram-positive bacteria) TaxID=192944 RepID=UPI0036669102
MPNSPDPFPRPDDLLPIGAFARASGITPSALRFYADAGVLDPEWTDPATGYRYYAPSQLERAVTLRLLREIDMPLAAVTAVLDADTGRAGTLIEEHVDALAARAGQARATAAAVRAGLGGVGSWTPVATVGGPVLAAAVDQVLSATAHDHTHPVLTGVHLEAVDGSLTLTATDRYRLSTRTITLDRPGAPDWSGTVAGDDLRLAAAWIRRRPVVDLRAGAADLIVDAAEAGARTCGLLTDPFPDHRAVVAGIPPVRTRLVLDRAALVRAVEQRTGDRVVLAAAGDAVTVASPGPEPRPVPVPATAVGAATTLAFEITTLYPAISVAAGPDLMLDIAGPDLPVLVRSADDGDLTTLVMPVAHPTPHEGDPA